MITTITITITITIELSTVIIYPCHLSILLPIITGNKESGVHIVTYWVSLVVLHM
jgi:hypothetical protein